MPLPDHPQVGFPIRPDPVYQTTGHVQAEVHDEVGCDAAFEVEVSGNLNIAAHQLLNMANIAVGGSNVGATGLVSVSLTLKTLTSAANAVAAGSATAAPAGEAAARVPDPAAGAAEVPSIITVEVVGYGDDSDETEDRDG